MKYNLIQERADYVSDLRQQVTRAADNGWVIQSIHTVYCTELVGSTIPQHQIQRAYTLVVMVPAIEEKDGEQ